MDPPRRFIEVWLCCHIALFERLAFHVAAGPVPLRPETPYPRHVIDGQLVDDRRVFGRDDDTGTAVLRSKLTVPSATASWTLGSASSLRAVDTRAFAVSGATSNRPVTHSAIERHPSAKGACRRSASRIRTIWAARISAIVVSAFSICCSIVSIVSVAAVVVSIHATYQPGRTENGLQAVILKEIWD